MPRRTRAISNSKVYHVMIRGNERKNIFVDEEDKLRFIDTLRIMKDSAGAPKQVKPEKIFSLYAYCIMDNHAHLLINEEEDNIARIMKRINTSYAYYFNKKYMRIGHLFQDRFRSEAIENDNYLLAVARYIHNNPVKAGIVRNPGEYRWSSYNEYMKQSGLTDTKTILEIFTSEESKARDLFKEYSSQQNDDGFIEYKERDEGKAIWGEKGVKEYIENYLNENKINLEELKNNKAKLKQLIGILKSESNVSHRRLATILNIDRGIVQRT